MLKVSDDDDDDFVAGMLEGIDVRECINYIEDMINRQASVTFI